MEASQGARKTGGYDSDEKPETFRRTDILFLNEYEVGCEQMVNWSLRASKGWSIKYAKKSRRGKRA